MATIYSNSNDGTILKSATGGSFGDLTTAATGSTVSAGVAYSTTAVRAYHTIHIPARFGISRSFLTFDTSTVTKQLYSLRLIIKGYVNADANVIVVKAKHSDSLNVNDYGQVVKTEPYSKHSTWSTSGQNIIDLNTKAMKNALEYDTLKLAIINYGYDYKGAVTSAGTDAKNGMYFQEARGTLSDPKIEYIERLSYYRRKRVNYSTAGSIASANRGGRENFLKDRNGEQLKQNSIVKFNPSFLRWMPGNWQVFPSASFGRTVGDGEVTLANSVNGLNFSFDLGKLPEYQGTEVSCSFLEKVS